MILSRGLRRLHGLIWGICRPPRENRPVPQENPFATSRNPLNGAPILAAPRLNLLARPVAATKVEGHGWPRAISIQLSAVSF